MKLTPELKEIALCKTKEHGLTGNPEMFLDFVSDLIAALPNSDPVAWQSEKNLDFVTTYPSKVKQWESSGYEVRPLYAAPPIPQDYKVQLAESQAREAKLNSVLCEIAASKSFTATPTQFYQYLQRVASNATFESFIATALNELIAKAGEVMRERAAIECETNYNFSDALANAIRDLPGVTLENLNHD